jgi:hypothetical protein
MNTVATESIGFVTTAGLSVSLLMALLLLFVPRRFAVLPVIILVCFMPMGQYFVLAGMTFTMIRVLLLFGWLRLFFRGEFRGFRWNTVDKLLIAWVIARTINYTIVWGTWAAFVNRMGHAYDIVGSYIVFRCIVRGPDDFHQAIRFLAYFMGPLAMLMVAEKLTGRNPFAVFGANPMSEIRDGVIRCQGPFLHSILAGTFGATTLPLFIGMWLYRRSALVLGSLAVISSTVITAVCGSSGPALAYVAAIVTFALWPMHRKMRTIRWGAVVVLAALQFVMSQPIWFVMARLTVFSGSTGWFRGFLIDQCIRHLGDWWLVGSKAAPTWHLFLYDITNQYLLEGLNGGLLALILFVAILAYSFRTIGQAVRSSNSDQNSKLFAWALGAALFAHAISFMSVSYFDQNVIILYMLLAGVSVVGVMPVSSPANSPASQFLPDPSPAVLAP